MKITNEDIRNIVTDDAASCENPYRGMNLAILRHRLAMVFWRQGDDLEELLKRGQERIEQAVNMNVVVVEASRVWRK